jgi:hypothetical protein
MTEESPYEPTRTAEDLRQINLFVQLHAVYRSYRFMMIG